MQRQLAISPNGCFIHHVSKGNRVFLGRITAERHALYMLESLHELLEERRQRLGTFQPLPSLQNSWVYMVIVMVLGWMKE
ncbi:hypothetical protein NC652_004955 [Populus alba x Populus x berolinensis]|nr:hypothetical protein NC652_004955 [Populus alba x Populus x berolinensis]